jgi:hypothetical protein
VSLQFDSDASTVAEVLGMELLDITGGTLKLDDSRIVLRTTDKALLAVAEDLELIGVPLCNEFAEMIVAANAVDAPAGECSNPGVAILAERMTAAEHTSAEIIYAASTIAHRSDVPDEVRRSVARRLAFFTARFESYLAERDVREVPWFVNDQAEVVE